MTADDLLGQTVVVIGGSAGIGLETARRARAEGADVILTDATATGSTAPRARSVPGALRRSTPTTWRLSRSSSGTSRPRSTT